MSNEAISTASGLQQFAVRVPFLVILLLATHPVFAQDDAEQLDRIVREKAARMRASAAGADQKPSDDPEVKRAIASWNARANAIRTARITWVQRRTDKKGSLNGRGLIKAEEGQLIPPTDVTYSDRHTLLLKDGDLRFDSSGQSWHAGALGVIDRRIAESYQDEQFRYLSTSPDESGQEQQGGMISDRGSPSYIQSIDALPIALTLAPFNLKIGGLYPNGLQRVPELDDTEGGCVQIGKRSTFLWLSRHDPAKLVRHETRRDGDIATQMTITWKQQSDVAVPDRWVLTSFDANRRIQWVKEFQVEQCALNDTIEDTEIAVQFPAGAHVMDEVRGIEGVSDGQGNVVAASVASGRGLRISGPVIGALLIVASLMFVYLARRRTQSGGFPS